MYPPNRKNAGLVMTSTAKESITETIKTIVYALLIAGVFRTLFFQPFYIPSGSMKDTLLIGDFIFVNKMAYGYSRYSCPFSACPLPGRLFGAEPERGDVVVFRHPGSGNDFIKRVIGLPGDTVQMKNGVVFINNAAVPQVDDGFFEEVYAPQGGAGRPPSCMNGPLQEGDICQSERKIETLPNGVSHSILNIRDSAQDNTKVFSVPAGNYFFMGDNRDNSEDSRFSPPGGVGYLPAEYLIGRADRIMFSSAGRSLFFFWTWRSDRFFKAVE